EEIAGMGRKIRPDVVGVGRTIRSPADLPRRRYDGAGIDMPRRVDDRDTGVARRRDELLCRLDRVPCIFPAGARKLLFDLQDRPVAAFIDELVEVDEQQGRPLADIGIARIAFRKLQKVRRVDVLPAMIFERGRMSHGNLLILSSLWAWGRANRP